MIEHTTDRLFWTLTSIIVGALILTIGINAFPKATQGVIQPISGVIKQADTVTGTANNTANDAMNNINPPTNSYGQTEEEAKKAAPSTQLFSNIEPTTGITWNIIQELDGNWALSGIVLPQGCNNSTLTIPEYINGHNPHDGSPITVQLSGLDSSSNFGITGDTSKLTTIKIPSSVKYINGGFFDMTTPNYHNFLSQNLTIQIPQGANINSDTQKPAIDNNDTNGTVTISAVQN